MEGSADDSLACGHLEAVGAVLVLCHGDLPAVLIGDGNAPGLIACGGRNGEGHLFTGGGTLDIGQDRAVHSVLRNLDGVGVDRADGGEGIIGLFRDDDGAVFAFGLDKALACVDLSAVCALTAQSEGQAALDEGLLTCGKDFDHIAVLGGVDGLLQGAVVRVTDRSGSFTYCVGVLFHGFGIGVCDHTQAGSHKEVVINGIIVKGFVRIEGEKTAGNKVALCIVVSAVNVSVKASATAILAERS